MKIKRIIQLKEKKRVQNKYEIKSRSYRFKLNIA